jgi:multiple sugar transport system permease protein
LVLVLALLSLYPAGYALFMSMQNWNWGRQFNFVGLANYSSLLRDPSFWADLVRTLYFTVGAVVIEVTLGFAIALAVFSLRHGSRLIGTILIVPLMVSGIVVSVIWKVMLDPTLGIIPWALRSLHLPAGGFLGDPRWAMPSIIGIDTWWQTGFVFIILLAGLQSLPPDVLAAAEVDGAGPWQKLRYVTMPLLRPFILTAALLRTVDSLKVFDIIFGTTGGGPVRSTETMQMRSYLTAFKQLQMSRAMTVTVIFAVLFLVVVLAFLAASRRIRADAV